MQGRKKRRACVQLRRVCAAEAERSRRGQRAGLEVGAPVWVGGRLCVGSEERSKGTAATRAAVCATSQRRQRGREGCAARELGRARKMEAQCVCGGGRMRRRLEALPLWVDLRLLLKVAV